MFCKIRFVGDGRRKKSLILSAATVGRLYIEVGFERPSIVKCEYGVMYNKLGRRMSEEEMLCHNKSGRLRLLTWEVLK